MILPSVLEYDRYGVKDRCLEFDGVDDYVDCGNDNSVRLTNSFSVEFWMYTTSSTTQYTVSRADVGGNKRVWFIFIGTIGSDYYLRVTLSDDGLNNSTRLTYLKNFSLNTWIHVCFAYNGAASFAKMYINGAEVSDEGVFADSIVSSLYTTDIPLFIGARYDTLGNSLNGKLDEVRIWNHARTADQIKRYMNVRLRGAETGLVAYYPMNENIGGVLPDRSQNSNNGTIIGAKWVPGNRCLSFDGVDDYVDCGSVYSIGSNNVTIELWIKPLVLGSGQIIVNKQNTGVNRFFFQIVNQVSTGNLNKFRIGVEGGSGSLVFDTGGITLSVDTWYHLVMTRNEATYKGYVNGVEDISFSGPDDDIGGTAWTIGGRTNPAIYVNAQIDEVRIWNHVCTESQIKANMFKELTGHEEGLVAYYPMNEASGSTVYDMSQNSNDGTITGATRVDY